MRQNDTKDMRTFHLAARPLHQRPQAKIDLDLFARTALHPAKRQLLHRFQLPDKSADTVITAGKTVLQLQILPDPLGRQSLLNHRLDDPSKRFALAFLPEIPGGRPGWF
jgi:hypothetical protein